MSEQPLVDQKFLEKLERLALRWQRSFPGLVGGHNPSRYPGFGLEFLDHRHFHYGDDLRAVNWRAYLRFEKLFLKIFRLEPHTPVRLLLDASASMATGGRPKFDYARTLAAALCYVGLVRLETILLLPFRAGLEGSCRCAGGRHRFAPVAEFLAQLRPEGRTDYLETVRQFVSRYVDRGLAIVISDFLDEQPCEKALQHLADFGHELMLIQVWAEEDRQPPWEGRLELIDAETGGRLELDFDREARERYTAAFDAHSRSLRRLALGNGGRYVGLSTDVEVEDAIFGPLARMVGCE